jgi:hypothetical protein
VISKTFTLPAHHALRLVFSFVKIDAWDTGKYFEIMLDDNPEMRYRQ